MDRAGVDRAVVICAGHRRQPRQQRATSPRTRAATVTASCMFADVDSRWLATHHTPGAAGRLSALADRSDLAGFTHYLREDGRAGAWLSRRTATASCGDRRPPADPEPRLRARTRCRRRGRIAGGIPASRSCCTTWRGCAPIVQAAAACRAACRGALRKTCSSRCRASATRRDRVRPILTPIRLDRARDRRSLRPGAHVLGIGLSGGRAAT